MYILENIIPEPVCDQFIFNLKKIPPQSITNNKIREGYVLESPREEEKAYSLMQQLNALHVRQVFPTRMENLDCVITRFDKGGFLAVHADNEIYQNGNWERSNGKEVTILVFLNDDYVGGEIIFPNQDVAIKAKKGTMIMFPSNHEYIYGMQPILQGTSFILIGHATNNEIVYNLTRIPIEMKNSKGKGRGVFTKNDIKKDDIIEESPVLVMVQQDPACSGKSRVSDFVGLWQGLGTGKAGIECNYIIMGIANFTNHSDRPNCHIIKKFNTETAQLIASRDIKSGEELFISYGIDRKTWFKNLTK